MRKPRAARLKILGIFGAFLMVLMGLGVLRYHAARLAYRLDSLNASIQRYLSEETTLKQELSGLVAPIKIYSYCKEQLGMTKVLKAEVLSVHSKGQSMARNAEEKKEGRGLAWLLGE